MIRSQKLIDAFTFILAFLLTEIVAAQNQSGQEILAKVGDKVITVGEFKERSEFIPRPAPFGDKNTTLNNLISEKLLAIEAERQSFSLSQGLLANIRGIKEQEMREELYYAEAFDKVRLDPNAVKNAYRLSQREYKVEYYTIDSRKLARDMDSVKNDIPQFIDSLFVVEERALGKKPVHAVSFKDAEDDAIHEALFTSLLNVGTVLGPIELSNGQYIVMKVVDWTDYPILGGEDQAIRWNEVKDKLRQIEGDKLWRAYEATVMRGKKMVFNKETFEILSSWAMREYLGRRDSAEFRITEIPVKPDIDLSSPFFTLDGKVWTVKDIRNEVMSHPLVFRTTTLNITNFKRQFQFAVIDLMRDHFLTLAAYRKQMDTLGVVRRTEKMWKDSFLSSYEVRSIMDAALKKGLIKDDDNLGKMKFWQAYLDSLQSIYSDSIRINSDEFKKIALTHIDMVAWRPQDPYPLVVPNFPTLISSGELGYAERRIK